MKKTHQPHYAQLQTQSNIEPSLAMQGFSFSASTVMVGDKQQQQNDKTLRVP